MKIEWIINILLITGIINACHPEKKQSAFSKGKVVVAGIIEEPDDYANIISLISVGPAETNRQTEIVDSTGQFRFVLDIIHPHILMIKYGRGTAYVYAGQEDSLFLKLNATAFESKTHPIYVVTGDHAETAMNIRQYLPYKNRIGFQPGIDKDMSVEDLLKKLRKGIQKEDSVLSAFVKKYHPTRDFMTLEKKGIIYRYANFLIHYKFFHVRNKTRFSGDLFDKNLFPVDDDSALVSSSYSLHLWHYATDRYMQKDTVVRQLIQKKELLEANRICLDNICRNEEPGLSRDVMCFRILNTLRASSYPDFIILWKNVDLFIRDTTLISLMEEKINLMEKQKNFAVSLLEPGSKEEQEITGDFWGMLKDKYKGKIIYIDFWATWCGPCLEEIPHAIKLHECYRNKTVAFVNVCMSSDKVRWKYMIENSKITGENYFLNEQQEQVLRNKLDIQGYPTYLIIDKNGRLVHSDAPRPSSGAEIKAVLDGLLSH